MKIVDYGLSICLYFVFFIIIQLSAVLSGLWLSHELMSWLSIGWILLTLLFYLLLKGPVVSWLYIVVNSIMAGIMIAWYYQHMNIPLYDFGNLLVILAGAMAINLAGLHLLDYKKNVHFMFCVIASLVLIYSAYQGGFLGIAQWNLVAIVSIMVLAFNMACMRFPGADGDHEFLAIAKMSSMLSIGLVFYCIMATLTDGESLDTIEAMVEGVRERGR